MSARMLNCTLAVLVLLCFVTNGISGMGYRHFYGGTMSYTIVENNVTGKLEVHIDMLTGWRLGEGPCGPFCNESDLGKDTVNERRAVETSYHDPYYFGNWSIETGVGSTFASVGKDNEVRKNMKGRIIALSEIWNWEQEQMSTVIVLSPLGNQADIVYEVYSWQELRLQEMATRDVRMWHLQSKLDVRKRSDTGIPNANPKALMKPLYRVKLNSISQITIPAIDEDGDIIKCTPAYNIEAEMFSNNPLPGQTIDLNCTITLNTSTALNYTDDTWGGVALTVRDYNKKDIQFDGHKTQANSFAIGGATVQFLVQVLEHLNQPEFVSPTSPSNHHVFLYTGTTFNVDVYAKSSENASITDFTVLGRDNEVVHISEIKKDTTGRDRVKHVTVSWEPAVTDTGSHIICVRAIDNTGVDTADDRCFIIEIKETLYHATTVDFNKPYFVDLPSTNEKVGCNIDSTCVFPIYVNSPGKIVDIKLETSFEFTKKGHITSVIHNGDPLYKMELSLMHNVDGEYILCLTAIDVNGVTSTRECIRTEIIAADPCLSAPCKNSATCLRKANDTADYECKCIDTVRFEGKDCDRKQFHDCDSSPCGPGRCGQKPMGGFVCNCRHTGCTGKTCSTNEDDCLPDSCNGVGMCLDALRSFTCSCYSRYTGIFCEHDLCPSDPIGQLHCSGVDEVYTKQPPDIQNASTNATVPGAYRNGSIAEYTCDRGHQFARFSSTHLTCDAGSNRWFGSEPVCVESICDGDAPGFAHRRSIRSIYENCTSCSCPTKERINTKKSTQDQETPTAKVLLYAGYGAAGITGLYAICYVLYISIQRLKTNGRQQKTVKKVERTPKY